MPRILLRQKTPMLECWSGHRRPTDEDEALTRFAPPL